jgi:hypothetical protein
MEYQVELVAQAFYEAEHDGGFWVNEPEACKQEYRGCARHAIALMPDNIEVVLLALEQFRADEYGRGAGA